MYDWCTGRLRVSLLVVPSFASSSAFSFPQSPVWAAIHLSSRLLLTPRWLRELGQFVTVLLLLLGVFKAWMEDKLSVKMMICLLVCVVRLLHASVIAYCSAWKTAVIRELMRSFVDDCIVVIGCDNVACSTAFFSFSSVCVAGYSVTRCADYGVVKLVSVNTRLVPWGCCCKIMFEVESGNDEVSPL